jgi:hypothetical protein
MDNESGIQQVNSNKYTCLFCQSFIKKSEEIIFCPECNSPYHIECWYENLGCALYGCKYKISPLQIENKKEESIQDILINAEYLININKFTEAITECRRVLSADVKNYDAKILHNNAVKLINAKTKLMEDGDNAYAEEKLDEARIFYRNALKYADDVESNLLNTKLQLIDEKIPRNKRKKILIRYLSVFISVIILCCVFYLYYYFVFLADLRELSEISKNDGNPDVQILEQQISRYEKFLSKYDKTKYFDEVRNKISLTSALLVNAIYKNDWRLALEYHNKIDEKETKNDLYKKIYQEALVEYKKLISNAKQFNKLKNFEEAISELEKANLIIDRFANSDFGNEKSKVNGNIILIERKKKAVPELASLNRKIDDITEQLKSFQHTDDKDVVEIEGVVIDKQLTPPVLIVKKIKGNKSIAVSGDVAIYKQGDFVLIQCKKSGVISYGDEELSEYATYHKGIYDLESTERESMIIELNNLKTRKIKLDSLLSLNLNLN